MRPVPTFRACTNPLPPFLTSQITQSQLLNRARGRPSYHRQRPPPSEACALGDQLRTATCRTSASPVLAGTPSSDPTTPRQPLSPRRLYLRPLYKSQFVIEAFDVLNRDHQQAGAHLRRFPERLRRLGFQTIRRLESTAFQRTSRDMRIESTRPVPTFLDSHRSP